MGSSCRPQSELRPAFWDSLHLAVSQPFVPAIVACVKPRHKGHDDLTSSPPSSELTPAVSYESPPLCAGNIERGLRSLRDLTQHLSLIHISEPTRRTPISYAVFCLKKKKILLLFSMKK